MTTTCSCSSVGNCNCAPGQCACASCHGGKDKNAQSCGCSTKDASGQDKCSCSSAADCNCGDNCKCDSCGKKGAAQ